MAIPAVPQNQSVQQGNGQVLISWSQAAGASAYLIKRSIDGVNFSALDTAPVSPYLDATTAIGTTYWYQIASTNGVDVSPYTVPQSIVPTPAGEMSLGEIRLRSKQRADRVDSDFVTDEEWNSMINQSSLELYDVLITKYQDQFIAPAAKFFTVGSPTYLYPLPDGQTAFINDAGQSYIAPALYKLRGVDLGLNTAANAWVTVPKFNFDDRNKFVYPNSASTIYGVFNMKYRMMGDKIEFVPTPSANQPMRLWYVPRLALLLKDNDITTIGTSGWLEYVIVDAAIKALQKEEQDVSVLMAQKQALLKRIEDSAANRDANRPDTITDVRQGGQWSTSAGGSGGSWPIGGF